MERLAVPARVRFEVFKRDKFTCQYCGARVPEVVLQVDHIKPVADDGSNDILNLITSCAKCNGGKGAIPLTNGQAIDRQVEMLAELEERRQQLKMMMKWRDELQNIQTDTVQMIADRIRERGGFALTETGRADVKKWIKKFNLNDLLRAIDEAFDTYIEYKDGKVLELSWDKAFPKIPGTASVISQEKDKPYLKRLFYIQGIVRKRSHRFRDNCIDYLEHVHRAGMPLDDLERRAKQMRNLSDFEEPIDSWLESIGSPF